MSFLLSSAFFSQSLLIFPSRFSSTLSLSSVAIAQWLYKGFPARNVPYYIFWQLLGGFLASLLVYVMYKPEIDLYENTLRAAGLEAAIFTNTGP